MCSKLKIYMGLWLLLIYVHAAPPDSFTEYIKEVISGKGLIDDIFMPFTDVPMSHGVPRVFQGMNMYDRNEVAMKFSKNLVTSKREYEMYSYLDAIDDTILLSTKKLEIESYGISPIYYYNGDSQSRSLIALSVFDCSLWYRRIKLKTTFNQRDGLILFRNFVRQIKYVHSRGVRHNDVASGNIMLRKGRSFLIDFDYSSIMNASFPGATNIYASRRYHQQIINKDKPQEPNGNAFDDWESFLYTMAHMLGIRLTWLVEWKAQNGNINFTKMGDQKKDINGTIETIKKHFGKDPNFQDLKEVMVQFAEEAFKTNVRFPDYNYFETLITEKINETKHLPAVFSWLKGKEAEAAAQDLRTNPPKTAHQIELPEGDFTYVKPDYGYFKEKRVEMAKIAKKNHENFLKDEKGKKLIPLMVKFATDAISYVRGDDKLPIAEEAD